VFTDTRNQCIDTTVQKHRRRAVKVRDPAPPGHRLLAASQF
jgi:hypothetical protein